MKLRNHKIKTRTLLNSAFLLAISCLLYYSIVRLPLIPTEVYSTGNLNERFFVFFKIIGLLVTVVIIYKTIQKGKTNQFRFKLIDITLSLYFIYCLVSYFFIANYNGISVKLIEIALLAVLYLLVRNISNLTIIMLLLIMTSAIIQAAYGLLQLYGVYDSNHNLFNITGSFFNPSPYAGYLAGIWPIALAIYLFRDKLPISSIKLPSLPKHQYANTPIYKFLSSKFHVLIPNTLKRRSGLLKHKYTISNKPMTNDLTTNDQPTNKPISKTLYNYLPFICLALMLLALPATHSRAAWLSIIATSGILLLLKSKLRNRLNTYLNSKAKKWLAITFTFIIIISGTTGLYYFKKGSADGRVLIWKSTALMIKDNPLIGIGFGKYQARYMDYQANYLQGKEKSNEAYLAGETNYAYNTILKQTTELGLIGLVFILSVLYFIFLAKPKAKGKYYLLLAAKMGIAGILIFSMFSYPEHILSIKILFVTLLAIVSSQSKSLKLQFLSSNKPIYQYTNKLIFKFKFLSSISKAVLLFITVSTFYFAYPIYRNFKTAYTNWINANWTYQIGIYDDCLEDYTKAYPVLKNNGSFLLNYGKALSMAKKHIEAIKILKETEKHLKNTIVYTAMGDSYKALEKPIEAEIAYKKAWQMVPGRFYAKYLLAKLYDETGQNKKAQKTANELLTKKVKVESTAIKEIKEEMKKIVGSHSSPQSTAGSHNMQTKD
jgi:O-antigen polymerase